MKLRVVLNIGMLLFFHAIALSVENSSDIIPILFCENINDDIVVIYNPQSNNLIVVEQGIEYSAPAVLESMYDPTKYWAYFHISGDLRTEVTLSLPLSHQHEQSFAASLLVQKYNLAPHGMHDAPASIPLSCVMNTLAAMEAQIAQSTF